jgi:hypothetical protein
VEWKLHELNKHVVSLKNQKIVFKRIESNVYHITEIVREYGGMDTAGGAMFSNYPTMSSRYGDFARDAHHQQSSAYSQRRNMHEYMIVVLYIYI